MLLGGTILQFLVHTMVKVELSYTKQAVSAAVAVAVVVAAVVVVAAAAAALLI
jgi:hypothetical protein